MRRTGVVAVRVAALLVWWFVLGRVVGLAVGGTPDASIGSSVLTTTTWFATAGAWALADARRARPDTYPTWLAVGLVVSALAVLLPWLGRAALGDVGSPLGTELVTLAPGLVVGLWACAAAGIALGHRDLAAQRPLTASATRASTEVDDPRASSRRSAAR